MNFQKPLDGITRKRYFIVASSAAVSILLLFYLSLLRADSDFHPQYSGQHEHDSLVNFTAPQPKWPRPDMSLPVVSCVGPRGKRLNQSSDDLLEPLIPDNVTFPEPMMGSYDILSIAQTWLSAAGRYGPYGFGQKEKGYKRSKVEWSRVRWGALQDQCIEDNKDRIPKLVTNSERRRFRLRNSTWEDSGSLESLQFKHLTPRDANIKSGRQAIVLRTWSSYVYKEEDLQNLRAIITEASLARGAEYVVFLLVDVKNLDARIHKNDTSYDAELKAAVPEEFRDIAYLFDTSLLENWYPRIGEWAPFWQIMQPFQMFAHLFPEFDHYWQFEMDLRITQHVGDLLNSLHQFGTSQPRKQSTERASWNYIPRFHGSYQEFTDKLNGAMKDEPGIWGPIVIGDEIQPIGPKPPANVSWDWGVGEDADLLLLAPLIDVRRMEDWQMGHWHFGFTKGDDLPWWMSTPAQARASWNLLNAVHHHQSQQDLRVHSEATLPSFALWHGLKVVGTPIPIYQHPARDRGEMSWVLNGGNPEDFEDGWARGPVKIKGSFIGFFTRGIGFDWTSPMPDQMMAYWKGEKKPDADMPNMLIEHEGQVLAPGMMLHPRKTNMYVS